MSSDMEPQPLPREQTEERATLRLELSPSQTVLPVLLRPESGRATTVLVRGSVEAELPPGFVTAELRLPSGERLVREATLTSGTKTRLVFDLGGGQHEALRPGLNLKGFNLLRPERRRADEPGLRSLSVLPLDRLAFGRGPRLSSAWEKRVAGVSYRIRWITEGWDHTPILPRESLFSRGVISAHWLRVDEEPKALSFTLLEPPSVPGLSALQVDLRGPALPEVPTAMSLVTLLPVPWRSTAEQSHGELRPVQYVLQPEPKAPGGLHPETHIQDPEVGMVLAYLERGDVGSALAYQESLSELAEGMLWAKASNPFAAAAGAYAMLRLGTHRLAWTERLWRMYEWLPDGGIVHASHLLRHFRPGSSELTVIRDALVGAAQQGPPVFSGGVRRLLDGLAQVASTRQFREDPEVRRALGYARALAGAALPDQQCTTLLAPREHLDDLLGGAAVFEQSPLNPGDLP